MTALTVLPHPPVFLIQSVDVCYYYIMLCVYLNVYITPVFQCIRLGIPN